ncbi:MAG: hypothetical protein ACOC58_00235 [Chloroflexota bacterium]
MSSIHITFRLPQALAQRLGLASGADVLSALENYAAFLDRNAAEFSEAEEMLLRDVLNSTILDVHTAHLLWANVEDGIRLECLAEKWQVDGTSLVSRLRDLSPWAAWQVYQRVKCWWREQK